MCIILQEMLEDIQRSRDEMQEQKERVQAYIDSELNQQKDFLI